MRFLLLMFVLFASLLHSQFHDTIPCPVPWGPTIQVSATTGSAVAPKLAVVGDTVHLVYYAGALYYRRSLDAGKTWEPQVELVPVDSMSGQVWNRPIAAVGRYVYVVWENRIATGFIRAIKIRRSTNGGQDWEEPVELFVNPGLPAFGGPLVTANASNVYVTATKPISAIWHYFLVHSNNNGIDWDTLRQITSVQESRSSADIAATPSGLHLVCNRGLDFVHSMSSDYGTTWTPEEFLSEIDSYKAWDAQIGLGDSGAVYTCWQDAKYGSSSGFSGTVLLRKSSNGGVNWQPEIRVSLLPSAAHSALSVSGNAVHVVWDDERNGVDNGTIQYNSSGDGGSTWCGEATVGDTFDLNIDCSAASTMRFAFVAWSSRPNSPPYHADIYSRVTNWGTTGVVEQSWMDRSQHITEIDVFPNPFNLNTRIIFSLSKRTETKLEIFDLLGRHVVTLADGVYEAGEYTVTWDATQSSSGIYLARLQAQDAVQQRKLLLIK